MTVVRNSPCSDQAPFAIVIADEIPFQMDDRMMPGTAHVKIQVSDLDEQTRFYTAVLGRQPVFVDAHTAVWITEKPRLRFEITAESGQGRQFVRSGPV
ncbi:MAG: hypothetical protein HKN35_06035 [Woeseia sp.]|nr:hypothetical protein [Woeseia sp.]